jgi:DNA invertase Pin-like site-specific DNA recombinase
MSEPIKCVIYRRYSTDEQGKGEGETLVTQLRACEAYAARKGWVNWRWTLMLKSS